MQHIVRIFKLLSLILILNGCMTMGQEMLKREPSFSGKGTGQFEVYEKAYDTTWNAVIEVMKTSKLQLITENKTSGQILAQKGMSAFSYGENVAIFVERQGSELKTRVEVVSETVMPGNTPSENWEKYILKELDVKLR